MSRNPTATNTAVVAALAAAAAGCGVYLLLRWRKYRVLVTPVYTKRGVRAARRSHTVKIGRVPGEDRGPCPMDPPIEKHDDLFWLRDDSRQDPHVLAHLHRENAYFEHEFAPLRPLKENIYSEFRMHTK
eukprot:gene933-2581_t